jgi:hypothetical protein
VRAAPLEATNPRGARVRARAAPLRLSARASPLWALSEANAPPPLRALAYLASAEKCARIEATRAHPASASARRRFGSQGTREPRH